MNQDAKPSHNPRVSGRKLQFIWLADCSWSMDDNGKIQALNQAIRNAIPEMRSAASENPQAVVFVRAIKFDSKAEWHIETPTPLDDFEWTDLKTNGTTAMGAAFNLVNDALNIEKMGRKNYPPVLVLISDGYATDDYKAGLTNLLKNPWGKRAIKIAIGLGNDFDTQTLTEFIDNNEIPVLEAHNPEQLTSYIKWASTEVLKSASGTTSDASKEKVVVNAPVVDYDDDDAVF